jgi:sugar transferase (PEP-CTERM/EpsH1 system associated)
MRILWVKAGGLLPADTGGKIRSLQILKNLAATNSVTLFSFYPAHPDDQHFHLREILEDVITYPLRKPVVARGFRDGTSYLANLLTRQPYSIAKYSDRTTAGKLDELVRERNYDVLICDFVFSGGNFPWESAHPKILFTHNVEAQIWQRHYHLARNPFWKAVCLREWKTMSRAEKSYAQRADRVLTVSDQDKVFFSGYVPEERISTIPTGVDVDYFSPSLEEEQDQDIVFVGSMDWLPNEDAAFYFCEQILPAVRKQLPDATFWIVGRRPSRRLQKELGRDGKGIRITGTVDDVRPYMRRGAVVVVPLRVGSGTRLKIFEAMACGKAVVSTTLGAEGLPVTDGEDIVLADDPKEFARAVVELCRDAARRRGIAIKARQLVQERYSWRIVANRFQTILGQVTEDRRPPFSAK